MKIFRIDETYTRFNLVLFELLTIPWPFPIAEGIGGSGAVVFGVKYFSIARHERTPFLDLAFRAFQRLSSMRYWLRSRYGSEFSRRHVVLTELKPGWHDYDEVILYAAFKCLKNFVELECNGLEAFKGHGGDKDIEDLYVWWTVTRPESVRVTEDYSEAKYVVQNTAVADVIFNLGKTGGKRELELRDEHEDQKMLLKLIGLRGRLWT